jgi:hypothetical protein
MDAYQLFSWLPSRLPSPHFGGCAQSKLTKSTVHLILTYSVPWWSMSTIARSNSSYFEFFNLRHDNTNISKLVPDNTLSDNWYLTLLDIHISGSGNTNFFRHGLLLHKRNGTSGLQRSLRLQTDLRNKIETKNNQNTYLIWPSSCIQSWNGLHKIRDGK